MSDTFTSFRYDLKQPFEYSLKGESPTAEFIELRAPSSKVVTICADLKQCFLRASTGGSGETEKSTSDKKPKEVEFTGDMIMMMVGMSKDVDLKSFYLHGSELFGKKGIALIDGEVSMKPEHLERISVEDFEAMLGEYLVNFTLASSLEMMKKLS
jgi:hypothetical protein